MQRVAQWRPQSPGDAVTLYQEDPEVRTRLEDLGIPPEALLRAARRGAGGFVSTTNFHARSAGGTYLYHETTAALRLELVPGGDWDHDEDDSQPRVYSDKSGVAIVVLTGDENTGIEGSRDPRSRNAKGGATRRKVHDNLGQLALFSLSPTGAERTADEDAMMTWVFLVAIVDDEVRAELSLPNDLDDENRPCAYHERILLPSQPLDGAFVAPTELPGDEGPEADIDVSWKQ